MDTINQRANRIFQFYVNFFSALFVLRIYHDLPQPTGASNRGVGKFPCFKDGPPHKTPSQMAQHSPEIHGFYKPSRYWWFILVLLTLQYKTSPTIGQLPVETH